MDIELMVSDIKIITDLGVEAESKIRVLINKSINDIKAEFGLLEVPMDYIGVVEDLVIYRLNTAIGIKSEGLGDRSITYSDGIPPEIVKRLARLRKVRIY